MFVYVVSYLATLVVNIGMFLILTALIATITLVERNILALVQRRVGPNYIGYKGRLQFIADAVNLLANHIYVLANANKFLFLLAPSLVLVVCYLFWANLLWGPGLALCEVEHNLLFLGVLSALFSLLLFLVGWSSQNNFAVLAAYSVLVVSLNLEILLGFLILYILILVESFSFYSAATIQSNSVWFIFSLLPITPIIVVVFLLETGRIPFDLAEAESELIAGHTTEMGGFFFALFYLGEYFHLYCFSVVYVLIFFGGWGVSF